MFQRSMRTTLQSINGCPIPPFRPVSDFSINCPCHICPSRVNGIKKTVQNVLTNLASGRLSHLFVGRSQAGVDVLDGRIYVVSKHRTSFRIRINDIRFKKQSDIISLSFRSTKMQILILSFKKLTNKKIGSIFSNWYDCVLVLKLFNRKIDCLIDRSFDCLIDRSFDWLIVWLSDRFFDWLVVWFFDWFIDWLI